MYKPLKFFRVVLKFYSWVLHHWFNESTLYVLCSPLSPEHRYGVKFIPGLIWKWENINASEPNLGFKSHGRKQLCGWYILTSSCAVLSASLWCFPHSVACSDRRRGVWWGLVSSAFLASCPLPLWGVLRCESWWSKAWSLWWLAALYFCVSSLLPHRMESPNLSGRRDPWLCWSGRWEWQQGDCRVSSSCFWCETHWDSSKVFVCSQDPLTPKFWVFKEYTAFLVISISIDCIWPLAITFHCYSKYLR